MKRILAFLSLVVLCCAEASAQTPQPLYPDGKFDGDNGLDSSVTADRDGVRFGVAVPDYFLFRPAPDKANGQCVVVLPGGGYGCVCYQREGIDVARWLNENGVTAVVLRYRMPNGHSEIPLTDVRRMFRTVRENAAEWGIDPCQVGVMGFSAGGHLAASALTLFEFSYARPDFGILIYPVITMQDGFSHGGSRDNLMGKDPSEDLIRRFSDRAAHRCRHGTYSRHFSVFHRAEQRRRSGSDAQQYDVLRFAVLERRSRRTARLSHRSSRLDRRLRLLGRVPCVAVPLAKAIAKESRGGRYRLSETFSVAENGRFADCNADRYGS